MTPHKGMANVAYDPNHLLDTVIERMKLSGDLALSRKLKVPKPVLGKIRNKTLSIDATMLVWMHEVTGISPSELRVLMGDRRRRFRLSNAYVNVKRRLLEHAVTT